MSATFLLVFMTQITYVIRLDYYNRIILTQIFGEKQKRCQMNWIILDRFLWWTICE